MLVAYREKGEDVHRSEGARCVGSVERERDSRQWTAREGTDCDRKSERNSSIEVNKMGESTSVSRTPWPVI